MGNSEILRASLRHIVLGDDPRDRRAGTRAKRPLDARDAYQYSAGKLIETIDRNLFGRYGDVRAFTINPHASDRRSWASAANSETPLIAAMNAYTRVGERGTRRIAAWRFDVPFKVVAHSGADTRIQFLPIEAKDLARLKEILAGLERSATAA